MNPTILVYVAGPFSAPTRAGVDVNIARAVAVGLEVAKLDLTPWIPHANTAHPEFEKIQPYPFWISGTTEMLRRCDAMIMVPDKVISTAIDWDTGPVGFDHWLSILQRNSAVEASCREENGSTILTGRLASWRESSGALRERDEAARLEIPTFDTIDELRAWEPINRKRDTNGREEKQG